METAIACCALLGPTFVLDSGAIFRKERHKDVSYDRIEMIRPENHNELMDDLRRRTGLDIHFVDIESIDFVRDMAAVRIYFYDRDRTAEQRQSHRKGSSEPPPPGQIPAA